MRITMNQALMALGAAGAIGTAAMGMLGLKNAALLSQALEESNQFNKAILAATRADMHHEGIQGAVYRSLYAVQAGDSKSHEEAQKDLQVGGEEIVGQLSASAEANIPSAIRSQISAALPVARDYVATGQSIQKLATQDLPQARKQLDAFNAAFDKLEVALAKPGDDLVKLGDELRSSGQQMVQTARMQILIGSLLCVCLLGTFCWHIVRKIMLSVNRARDAAMEVSRGNLNYQILVEGYPELRQVLHNLNEMSGILRRVIGDVKEAAEAVASGGEQVAQGNMDLSSRTESQAQFLEETVAAMHQVSTSVQHSADQVTQANQLARQAAHVAEAGGAVVTDVIHSMQRIDVSSRKISDIISVIDGIAFQTNILALNAAVEAARAGDAGRGFAVVASEVRALAQRSAQAAQEIKNLILTSVEEVSQGSALVGQAGSTMNEVVESVTRVTLLMEELTGALREQSNGTSQVSIAIGELDATTQQNAALVEEGAAAAHSLHDQSHRLVESVSIFKLA